MRASCWGHGCFRTFLCVVQISAGKGSPLARLSTSFLFVGAPSPRQLPALPLSRGAVTASCWHPRAPAERCNRGPGPWPPLRERPAPVRPSAGSRASAVLADVRLGDFPGPSWSPAWPFILKRSARTCQVHRGPEAGGRHRWGPEPPWLLGRDTPALGVLRTPQQKGWWAEGVATPPLRRGCFVTRPLAATAAGLCLRFYTGGRLILARIGGGDQDAPGWEGSAP